MSAIRQARLISVEAYLTREATASVKHEYLAGVVYALAGGSNRHNRIVTHLTVAVGARLRGQPCQPCNSDTKIRVQLPTHLRFYYPDLSIVCEPNPEEDTFQDQPVVIFEVLSASTRRTDENEKREAYLTIPTLQVYALVEQESATVVLFRRTEQGFVREVYEGLQESMPLPEVGIALPLQEIYEGVEFTLESLPE